MNLRNNSSLELSQSALAPASYTLRPMERGDLDTMANWYLQVEDVSIFDRQVPIPINRDKVAAIIEDVVLDRDKDKCRWYIAENEDGDGVGMCGLEAISLVHGNAILPVFVAKPWRRSGIGIRMACLMIDLAFKQLRLHRVATVYRSDNTASKALIERCGFREEGVSRQSWFSQGQHFDLINVGILAEEWQATRVDLRETMNSNVRASLGPRASDDWVWP